MNFDGSRLFYDSPFWKELSRECKERDGYQCVECGETRRSILHAHHKIPRRPFNFPTELDILQNLVCLCANCHVKQHPHMHKPNKQPQMFRAHPYFTKRRYYR